ncbi:MAG: hypothetical protein R6U13_03635 [Desulfatiglandaceae bacterium]
MKNNRFIVIVGCGAGYHYDVGEPSSPEEEWASSPIQCMEKAIDKKPGIIVILFGKMPIREREALVELSAALKRNIHTRRCRLLALLYSKHRKLIEDLKQAKVDYVRYIGDAELDSTRLREIIDGLGPDDILERHLTMLCPFLNYSKIDSRHEMKMCGAYLNRMVLGGRRLHEICETEDHFHCEYYLNPRLKP